MVSLVESVESASARFIVTIGVANCEFFFDAQFDLSQNRVKIENSQQWVAHNLRKTHVKKRSSGAYFGSSSPEFDASFD